MGKIPLTAVLKGQFQETDTSGLAASRLPSLEQSLVWKPAQDTTLEVGLRRQHYQDFPGISNALNEAVFADWSQKILGEVTWHSYAEMLNSRSTIEVAAAGVGANGTAQPTLPGGNLGLGSSLPVSMTDEALTFVSTPERPFRQHRIQQSLGPDAGSRDHGPGTTRLGFAQGFFLSGQGIHASGYVHIF